MTSVDGRINAARWPLKNASRVFERTAAQIKVDAWLVGRTTMQEFSSRRPRRRSGRFTVPPGDFVAAYDTKTFAIAIDPQGKCRWDDNHVDTEHVIEVLTEAVSAEYLDHLRSRNVSYLFGGRKTLDLDLVLRKLRRLFPIKRLRIDGGGTVCGSFLAANLIDEFSHVIVPVADGTIGNPSVFEIATPRARTHPGANLLKLKSFKRLPGGIFWSRYRVLRR